MISTISKGQIDHMTFTVLFLVIGALLVCGVPVAIALIGGSALFYPDGRCAAAHCGAQGHQRCGQLSTAGRRAR